MPNISELSETAQQKFLQLETADGGLYIVTEDELRNNSHELQIVCDLFVDMGLLVFPWNGDLKILSRAMSTRIQRVYNQLHEHIDDPTYAVAISDEDMPHFVQFFSNFVTFYGEQTTEGKPTYGVTTQGNMMWLSLPDAWTKAASQKRYPRG